MIPLTWNYRQPGIFTVVGGRDLQTVDMQIRVNAMVVGSKIVLPIEPAYIGHRDADERRKQVAEWLRQRERELDEHPSPSVVPDPTSADRQ
jgi:hypothetical protein